MSYSKEYTKYLESEHWKALRKSALDRAVNKCEACSKKTTRGGILVLISQRFEKSVKPKPISKADEIAARSDQQLADDVKRRQQQAQSLVAKNRQREQMASVKSHNNGEKAARRRQKKKGRRERNERARLAAIDKPMHPDSVRVWFPNGEAPKHSPSPLPMHKKFKSVKVEIVSSNVDCPF